MSGAISVREMTLNAIADDFEDFEMILYEVGKWSSEQGTSALKMAWRKPIQPVRKVGK